MRRAWLDHNSQGTILALAPARAYHLVMENETEKLRLAQDRLMKVLADTHCDFVTINRLPAAIERASARDHDISGSWAHVKITVDPGGDSVSWTVDSTKIREKIAGRYSA